MAFGALVDVGRDGLGAVGGKFTVREGHEFFRSDGMRGGAHARSPFWATACVAGCEAT